MRRRIGILAVALSFGFAGAAVGQPADSSIELVSADTPVTTASGATFTAPSGWRLTSTASKKVLAPPEADSHLALVDVRAANAAAAVAAGWASYRPDAMRPLRIATPQAPQMCRGTRWPISAWSASNNAEGFMDFLSERGKDSG